MLRTEIGFAKNIFGGVHVTIMKTTAFQASPISYSKPCDTFRPRIGQSAAIRAGLGGKTFVNFLVPCAMLNSLVRKHCSEGRPASIKNGLCHVGLGKSGGAHIADSDVIKLADQASGKFMVEVVSAVFDSGVDCFYKPLLLRSLGARQCIGSFAVNTLRFNSLAIGQGREIFQPQINPDSANRLAHVDTSVANVYDDIQEPVASRVSRKVGAVLDLPFRKWAAAKHTEGLSVKTEGISFAPQLPASNRNPSKRVLIASVSKVRTLVLNPRLRVLSRNLVDGAGTHGEFFAASRGKFDQVEAAEPSTAKSDRVLLSVIAEIPDEINRPRLPVQLASQRLDAVAVSQNHFCFARYSSMARRISSATESPVF